MRIESTQTIWERYQIVTGFYGGMGHHGLWCIIYRNKQYSQVQFHNEFLPKTVI